MAILSNLLVNGESRLLGKLYANDVGIGGKITATQIHIDTTKNAGNVTSDNSSLAPLVIGQITGKHIAIDADEIAAKSNATTGTSLYLNYGGGIVYLSNGGSIYATNGTFRAPTVIVATSLGNTSNYVPNAYITTANITTGNITDIHATNIDVSDTLRATRYSIETVQNLGGHFLVCPTIEVPSDTTGVTNPVTFQMQVQRTSNTQLKLTIIDQSFANDTFPSNTGTKWTANSKVKVSGTINNIPLGTCDGVITSWTTSNKTVVLTITCGVATKFSTTATNYTASQVQEFSAMLYELYHTTNKVTYPIGVYLTAYGKNKYSYVDVYGGTSNTPSVRMGKLDGLPAVNDITPTGWGFYSDGGSDGSGGGYFGGKLVSPSGKIGGFTIGSNAIYSSVNALGTTANNVYIGTEGISLGTTFKVTKAGAITATSGTIGNFTLGTAIYSGTNSISSTTAGVYLGTDGVRNYKDANTYVSISNGVITAKAVDLSGTITAQSGSIGGFHITSSGNSNATSADGGHIYTNSLYRHSGDGTTYEYEIGIKGDATENPSSTNTQSGNLAFYARRIAKGAKWNTSETMFYVTHGGSLYAKSADITGKVTANTGYIGGSSGWTIAAQQLYSGTIGNDNSLHLGTKNLGNNTSVGGRQGSDWRLTVGSKFGITNTGALYCNDIHANAGYIGSYELGTQYLQATDGTTGMSIKNDSNTKDWAFWAGGTTKETAKFRVTHDGDLYAQSLFVNIGGRNLIKGTQNPVISSTDSQYTWIVESGGDGTGTIETVTDSPVPSVSRSFRITGNTSGNKDFVQKTDEFQKNWGSQWTFSAYVRGIGGNATVLIRSWNHTDNNSAFTYTKTVGTSWEKVIVRIPIDVSWNSSASASDTLDIRFGMTGAGAIEYIAPKFEQGIVATDWSPAPEDSITSWKINANDIKNESTSHCTFSISNDVVTVTRLDSTNVFGCYYDLPCKPNKYYSASMRVTAGGTGFDFYFGGDYGSGSVWTGMGVAFQREANGIRRATIYKPTSSTQTYIRIYIGSRTQNSTISFRDLTVYEGDDLMMVDKDVVDAAADAAKTATDYLTFTSSAGLDIKSSSYNSKVNIKSDGVRIYDQNGKERNLIDSNGVKIKDASGNVVASLATDLVIGREYTNLYNVKVDADGGVLIRKNTTNLSKFDGNGVYFYDGSTVTSQFTKDGAIIGKTSSNHIALASNQFQLKNNGTVLADFGSTITLGQTSGQAAVISSTNGMQIYKDGNQIAKFSDGVILGKTSNPTFSIVNDNTMQLKEVAFPNNITITGSQDKTFSKTLKYNIKDIISVSCNVYETGKRSDMTSYNTTVQLTPSKTSDTTSLHSARISYSKNGNKVEVRLVGTTSGYYASLMAVEIIYTTENQGVSKITCGIYPTDDNKSGFIIGGGTSSSAKNIFSIDWFGNLNYQGGFAQLAASDYSMPSTTTSTNSIVPCYGGMHFGDCFGRAIGPYQDIVIEIKKSGYYYVSLETIFSSVANSNSPHGIGAAVLGSGTSFTAKGSMALGRDSTWQTRISQPIIYFNEGEKVVMIGRSEDGTATLHQGIMIIRPAWFDK